MTSRAKARLAKAELLRQFPEAMVGIKSSGSGAFLIVYCDSNLVLPERILEVRIKYQPDAQAMAS